MLTCKTSERQRRTPEPSFYHWKSVFNLSPGEKQRLAELKVRTLYLKLFDVDWNGNMKLPQPLAQTRFIGSDFLNDPSLQVIPVIFITNECIYKIDSAQIPDLAVKIVSLSKNIRSSNRLLRIPEIQIDCDWTAATKGKYFSLLRGMQELEKDIPFSATIRLHQIKYSPKTGIPPVSRGMLMCYNMGNLTDPSTENSILEIAELKKYIGNLDHYPLPLDVALPLFEWKVLFRSGRYAGLLQNLSDELLVGNSFTKTGDTFIVKTDTTLAGYELRKADVIRPEKSNYKNVVNAAEILSEKISNTRLRVALYHLDEVILKKYSTHEMETVYYSLR